MKKYFNVFLEFNHAQIKNLIEGAISTNEPGYVCIIDANVLTIAQQNSNYCSILNESLVNSCDGSSIATLANFVYKKNYKAWNGPDIFEYYIEKKYKQLLLGSTEEIAAQINNILKEKGLDNSHIVTLTLPFAAVEDFDYIEIAKKINEINPDIIWVSLGAPKQEIFMNRIRPLLSRGVMFGIGAAFNFYIGTISLPKFSFFGLRFIWVSRIFSEPQKQLRRILPYIVLIPKLWWKERAIYKKELVK